MGRHGIVWLHDIRSAHNVGSILRSVDAFGFGSVILSGYTPLPSHPGVSKSALGAEESVAWMHAEDPIYHLERLRRDGVLLAALEQTSDSIPLHSFRPSHRKICIVGGGEVHGLEDGLLEKCDLVLEIPQYGVKHSLNVSVALSVAMHHLSDVFRDR